MKFARRIGYAAYLHYIDWSEGKSSPRTFKSSDYEALVHSGILMARKFDVGVDREIINMLVVKVCMK